MDSSVLKKERETGVSVVLHIALIFQMLYRASISSKMRSHLIMSTDFTLKKPLIFAKGLNSAPSFTGATSTPNSFFVQVIDPLGPDAMAPAEPMSKSDLLTTLCAHRHQGKFLEVLRGLFCLFESPRPPAQRRSMTRIRTSIGGKLFSCGVRVGDDPDSGFRDLRSLRALCRRIGIGSKKRSKFTDIHAECPQRMSRFDALHYFCDAHTWLPSLQSRFHISFLWDGKTFHFRGQVVRAEVSTIYHSILRDFTHRNHDY
jgi:hypothetical protein